MDQPQPMLVDAFKMSVEGETVVIEFGRGAGCALGRTTDDDVAPGALRGAEPPAPRG